MLHEKPVSLDVLRRWTDGSKHVIATHASPLVVRQGAALVGSNEELVDFVRAFPYRVGAIYVSAEDPVLTTMDLMRPELEFFKLTTKAPNAPDHKEQNDSGDGKVSERGREAGYRFDQLF